MEREQLSNTAKIPAVHDWKVGPLTVCAPGASKASWKDVGKNVLDGSLNVGLMAVGLQFMASIVFRQDFPRLVESADVFAKGSAVGLVAFGGLTAFSILVARMAEKQNMKNEKNSGSNKLMSIQQRLLEAAAEGDSNEVINAIKAGADPKITTPIGETALMIAARQDQHECVRILLPISDVKAENRYGFDALHMAESSGHGECADIIAEYIIAQRAMDSRKPKL